MSPRTLAATVAALSCLLGCPGPKRPGDVVTAATDDPALRLRVARAEALRAGGVAELRELALHGVKAERLLALRGLGRIGGAQAVEVLRSAVADRDVDVFAHAVAALGLAGSLDEDAPLTAAMITRLPKDPALVALIFEGLGRGGDASTQDTLAAGLAGPPAMAAAAAIGLGRHGRRKLALAPGARKAL
ncbi:MAG: hypothetical protein KF773_41300, partial [Deltaproteobacteria bacterium]|nr:hypothetical protein [Deltaproteobacteria bacterium]